MNIKLAPIKISYDLIIDGKIMYDNLEKLGKDKVWLKNEISKFNLTPNQVLLFELNGDGTFFCQPKIKK